MHLAEDYLVISGVGGACTNNAIAESKMSLVLLYPSILCAHSEVAEVVKCRNYLCDVLQRPGNTAQNVKL